MPNTSQPGISPLLHGDFLRSSGTQEMLGHGIPLSWPLEPSTLGVRHLPHYFDGCSCCCFCLGVQPGARLSPWPKSLDTKPHTHTETRTETFPAHTNPQTHSHKTTHSPSLSLSSSLTAPEVTSVRPRAPYPAAGRALSKSSSSSLPACLAFSLEVSFRSLQHLAAQPGYSTAGPRS